MATKLTIPTILVLSFDAPPMKGRVVGGEVGVDVPEGATAVVFKAAQICGIKDSKASHSRC